MIGGSKASVSIMAPKLTAIEAPKIIEGREARQRKLPRPHWHKNGIFSLSQVKRVTAAHAPNAPPAMNSVPKPINSAGEGESCMFFNSIAKPIGHERDRASEEGVVKKVAAECDDGVAFPVKIEKTKLRASVAFP